LPNAASACIRSIRTAGATVAHQPLVALDPNAEALAELERIERVTTLVGDAAEEASNRQAVALAMERFGRVDVVVLNAGIAGAPPIEASAPTPRKHELTLSC
jgi:NAD(P)-dependent dehydrogenase (short-subunit alcohol dehydrogenase family)